MMRDDDAAYGLRGRPGMCEDLSYGEVLYNALEVALIQAGYDHYQITVDFEPRRLIRIKLPLPWYRRICFDPDRLAHRIRRLLALVDRMDPTFPLAIEAVPRA